jgi:hypothetical protein
MPSASETFTILKDLDMVTKLKPLIISMPLYARFALTHA